MGCAERIEVAFSDGKLDSAGASVKNDILEDLGIKGVEKVRSSEVYYFGQASRSVSELAERVFLDPVTQEYSTTEEIFADYDFCIEVRYHEDVTDNVGMAAGEAMEDYTGEKTAVKSARRYYIYGKVTRKQAEAIASGLLANKAIETYEVREGKK